MHIIFPNARECTLVCNTQGTWTDVHHKFMVYSELKAPSDYSEYATARVSWRTLVSNVILVSYLAQNSHSCCMLRPCFSTIY